ncbi:UDP-N-acetylmuramate dehydrogenase [Ponticaulis profundi]|uniref:UDP-N-acetylenolpyruvoylglucosamine reductase n=1 Tax=Ponticaulis profundi TaxID=2665222 RepID=A0ABW1S590_9PROT
MKLSADDFQVRGKLIENATLAPYTWFRVGGPADLLFLPADEDDLSTFLKALPEDVPVTTLGVGSNIIIRDGGIEGVVIRLAGGHWGQIEQINGTTLHARAGALDIAVAKSAARFGIGDLSFLSGIPGSIGGAIRTNAGCYGRELKDVLNQVEAYDRHGQRHVFQGTLVDYDLPQVGFSYRHTDFPSDLTITGVLLSGEPDGDTQALLAEIKDHQARRAETQPIRDKTSGSTFANPDPPGTPNQRSAWKLIDAAGCRGLRVGGAQVSEKHCNFLINTGDARASDLEALGELVRARVLETSGVELRWEVRRIGRLRTEEA